MRVGISPEWKPKPKQGATKVFASQNSVQSAPNIQIRPLTRWKRLTASHFVCVHLGLEVVLVLLSTQSESVGIQPVSSANQVADRTVHEISLTIFCEKFESVVFTFACYEEGQELERGESAATRPATSRLLKVP